jgi:hypothetical protein
MQEQESGRQPSAQCQARRVSRPRPGQVTRLYASHMPAQQNFQALFRLRSWCLGNGEDEEVP